MSSLQNPSIVLYGPGDARFEDRPAPRITDPMDAIIRIKYVGVHFWNHGGIANKVVTPEHPLTIGHEASGTIHAVGSGVTHLRPGDNVAIEPGRPCRACVRCKEGNYNLCPDMAFAACTAPKTHGCLSKYFKIPADFCYKLPPDVHLIEGVLAEPLAVAAHAVRAVKISYGSTLVVFGSGTIGLLCGAVARLFGAKTVVLVDVQESKLEFARGFIHGVGTYLPKETVSVEEHAATIMEEFGLGLGADAVIEATGAETCIQTGVRVLRPGGSYVQTGLGKPIVNFPIVAMSEKEIHMHGAFRYGPGDYRVAMNVLEARSIPVRDLVSKTFEFERATEAWEATKRGRGIKNMIRGYGYRE
ncbi:hypothetical protein PV10_00924 [Exophiala mesophila]|uniref:D-xylulose reductase n=1 Tax=Exophiala mesophila TaxID=212818 RepID=A0A0D2AE26_EXOME|nr:uncharacterized protein PV10_00924 [Exophiala mesophila]KIV97138.1 hypothetical protein PV10_00924 [Exophiala mesophila]